MYTIRIERYENVKIFILPSVLSFLANIRKEVNKIDIREVYKLRFEKKKKIIDEYERDEPEKVASRHTSAV